MTENLIKYTIDKVNNITDTSMIMIGGSQENDVGQGVASKGTVGLLQRMGVLTEILTQIKEVILDKCVILCSTILYISVYPVIPFFAIMAFMIATIKYIFWKFRKL